jgi:hypothetical protein
MVARSTHYKAEFGPVDEGVNDTLIPNTFPISSQLWGFKMVN